MFRVDDIQFGRVSWYYETVYGCLPLVDIGYPAFTPMDLGARWVEKQAGWERGTRVLAFAGGNTAFDRYLAACGIEIVTTSTLGQGYVAGAYVLAEAEAVLDIFAAGGQHYLHRNVFPFGKVLLAVQLPFASNLGFDHVRAAAQNEKEWLSLPHEAFTSELPNLPRDLAVESPALLARLVVNSMQAINEPEFGEILVERFVFEPDVMTTPMGRRVVDQAAAERLQKAEGERADRHGILLLSLSRTARV